MLTLSEQEQLFTTLLSVPEVFLDKKYVVNHFFNTIDLNKIHEFLKLNGWKENYPLENRLFKAYDRNQKQVIVSNDIARDHKTVIVELILNLSVIHKMSILEMLKQVKKIG
jgi:hypothetical protein